MIPLEDSHELPLLDYEQVRFDLSEEDALDEEGAFLFQPHKTQNDDGLNSFRNFPLVLRDSNQFEVNYRNNCFYHQVHPISRVKLNLLPIAPWNSLRWISPESQYCFKSWAL